jgi:hypothetical protein
MSEQKKNWRDAKLPQWVKDSIERDMKASEIRAALSWPTEAKPTPLPFYWGAYDQLHGTAVPGTYYTPGTSLRVNVTGEGYNARSHHGEKPNPHSQVRGPLFKTLYEARLYSLWEECDNCAKKIMAAKLRLSEATP